MPSSIAAFRRHLLTAKAATLCLALLLATEATAQQATARIVGTINKAP